MVDKLIKGRIVEIIIVILLVFVSIPVWLNFDERISKANVTTLADYNLNFKINSQNNEDKIIITNEYPINKTYEIKLKLNKKVDTENSILIINNKSYNLNEFKEEYKRGNYYYTIATDYIMNTIHTYTIKLNLNTNNTDYSYLFEENTYF